jgi:hypothetical protein
VKKDCYEAGLVVLEMASLWLFADTPGLPVREQVEGRLQLVQEVFSGELAGLLRMMLTYDHEKRPSISGIHQILAPHAAQIQQLQPFTPSQLQSTRSSTPSSKKYNYPQNYLPTIIP